MDAVDLESEWVLLSRKVIYADFGEGADPADVRRLEELSKKIIDLNTFKGHSNERSADQSQPTGCVADEIEKMKVGTW